MKETVLGSHLRKVPSIAVGCMRLSEKSKDEMNHFIHSALEQGAYFFDHADIYGSGMSETVFGDAFASDPSPAPRGCSDPVQMRHPPGLL